MPDRVADSWPVAVSSKFGERWPVAGSSKLGELAKVATAVELVVKLAMAVELVAELVRVVVPVQAVGLVEVVDSADRYSAQLLPKIATILPRSKSDRGQVRPFGRPAVYVVARTEYHPRSAVAIGLRDAVEPALDPKRAIAQQTAEGYLVDEHVGQPNSCCGMDIPFHGLHFHHGG